MEPITFLKVEHKRKGDDSGVGIDDHCVSTIGSFLVLTAPCVREHDTEAQSRNTEKHVMVIHQSPRHKQPLITMWNSLLGSRVV